MDIDQTHIINRLKRAEGQLRGIQKMIDEGKECEAVVTQLSAVISSIDSIKGIVVAENLKYCLTNPDNDTEMQNQKIEKAINLIIKK
ncbi:metal-sensitive transcriptional regulator [Aerococcaceae bacterium DSM 111176]|nr:metal-sensitive transcriptional regulator [Aerococcaceae bacterium DSM 111176]